VTSDGNASNLKFRHGQNKFIVSYIVYTTEANQTLWTAPLKEVGETIKEQFHKFAEWGEKSIEKTG
jgi:hypothetical protein